MGFDTLPQLMEFYGRDAILLIGGDLHRQGDDLVASCAEFLRIVESLSASIE
jgi:ribulose-bisphosphate carboxylase large chain